MAKIRTADELLCECDEIDEPPCTCGHCGADVDEYDWECWYCGGDLP